MAHLLHIDSSIQGDRSVSRKLTARAAATWRAAHPGGTVTYRDLGSNPIPHLDAATGTARIVPPEQRTPAQAASWALTEELVNEIKEADTILLGLPLYNFGAPSSVKASGTPREGWDHAEPWLPHALEATGLEPRFIAAELTLAEVTPAMAELIPLAAKNLAAAEQAIDGLWSPASALA